MFPCCYIGTQFDSGVDSFDTRQIKSKINANKKELDLNVYDINIIIESGILEKIFTQSWSKESIQNGKMAYCLEMCGNNNDLERLYIK